ncbi:hypothetical protein APX70_06494 [Pseudomonas syringae pv. maculicola]|uniref:Uncharacterized protein n=1 Tax=Pseudomonas syringae pv. maculicola TaxID=59511 RepID=A0A3M2Y6W0_PSEYM|nr:hypothetical protein APX70_06494 [Pseudomonas syringae pv. maculicola]
MQVAFDVSVDQAAQWQEALHTLKKQGQYPLGFQAGLQLSPKLVDQLGQ